MSASYRPGSSIGKAEPAHGKSTYSGLIRGLDIFRSVGMNLMCTIQTLKKKFVSGVKGSVKCPQCDIKHIVKTIIYTGIHAYDEWMRAIHICEYINAYI